MKRLRWRERKRFVRMRIKNWTFDRVAIRIEKSRYWESKNNLNVWMRTIQDKRKKNNKEIKMRELKKEKGGTRINIKRKIRIGLMQFRNLKLLFTQVISHPFLKKKKKKSNFPRSSSCHFLFYRNNGFLLLFFLWVHWLIF